MKTLQLNAECSFALDTTPIEYVGVNSVTYLRYVMRVTCEQVNVKEIDLWTEAYCAISKAVREVQYSLTSLKPYTVVKRLSFATKIGATFTLRNQ